jgi:hypothetical protein
MIDPIDQQPDELHSAKRRISTFQLSNLRGALNAEKRE